MITATLDRLRRLRLGAMADAYLGHQQDTALSTLGFDERFSMLADAEYLFRDNRALARRLKEAKLRIPHACLEDLDHSPRRGLDRALARQLATCRWVVEHQNVLITGATGVGKTYLACALGQQACRQGYRVIYRRLPRLFEDLTLEHADGSYTTLLARLARVDVLVLDDWGLAAVTDIHRHDLLEILDDRDGSRSTVLTSQLPRERWHDYLGDPTVADAILDRLSPSRASGGARRALTTQRAAADEAIRGRLSQAVDAARPMDTPERCPQVFGKPHSTRFPTAPTAILDPGQDTKEEPTRLYQEAQDSYTAERQASLRSDHDAWSRRSR